MTIIFGLGDEFWIESHQITISILDAVGISQSGNIALDRPGTCLGITMTGIETSNVDNIQLIGGSDIGVNGNTDNWEYGLHIFDFRVRLFKLVGTGGATPYNINVLLFMRTTH